MESIYGYKQVSNPHSLTPETCFSLQLQLTMIEKEVQKVTKKMSQTIEFTQRLLKYSSPTEVIVFKPLLDSRLQGFLTFNADPNNLRDACEIRTGTVDLQQARQTLLQMVNQLRSDSWLQSPSRASPPDFPGEQFKPDFFDRGAASQQARAFADSNLLSSFSPFSAPMGAAALATSAPTGTNGFGVVASQQDNKVSNNIDLKNMYFLVYSLAQFLFCWF